MDDTLPDQQPSQTPPSSPVKAIIFEIFFVAIVLVLFFGILNYFNILRLSAVFPNYLGFLPHRPYQQSKQFNNLTITPTPNYSPNIFQYDREKAKTILTQYIKENIKPELLPPKFEVIQGGSKDEFSLKLKTTNGDSLFSLFHFNKDANTVSDISIFIQPSNPKQQILTVPASNTLLSSHFKNPYLVQACGTKDTRSYCEQFQSEETGKKGALVFKSRATN